MRVERHLLRNTAVLVGLLLFFLSAFTWTYALADAEKYAREFEQIRNLAKTARYADALETAERISREVKSARSENDPDFASATSWIAFLYQVQGHYREAGPYFEKAVEIYEKIRPAGHPELASAINNLGVYYVSVGKRDPAERLYRRALEMREQAAITDNPNTADTLINLAAIYSQDGRTGDAQSLLERALVIRRKAFKPDNPLIASNLQVLAGVLEQQGNYPEAERNLRAALDIRRKSQVSDHPEVTGVLSRLGQILNRQGRFQEAEKILRKAIELRLSNRASSPTDTANTYSDLALNQLQQGDYVEAEAYYREVLALRESVLLPNSAAIADAKMRLAEVLDRAGKSQEALTTIRSGTEIRTANAALGKDSRFHYMRHVMFAWHNYLPTEASANNLMDEALSLGQRAEHTETAAALSRMAARVATKDSRLQKLVREREELEVLLKQTDQRIIANLALPPEKRVASAQLKAEFEETEDRALSVDKELKNSFPEYFDLIRAEPLSVNSIAEHLNEHEALIAIACGTEESYAWAISKNGAKWHSVDYSADALGESVRILREKLDVNALQKNPTVDMRLFDLELAHELYVKLLAPLEEVFAQKSQLIVVPCGALTSLPLGLLVRATPPVRHPTLEDLSSFSQVDWLIRHHAISVLPSVQSLKLLRQTKEASVKKKPLIGFGNPRFAPKNPKASSGPNTRSVGVGDYSTYWHGATVNLDALLNDLPELPQTATELQVVAAKLGASSEDIFLGASATETTVKSTDLLPYQIVYFATHGLVAGEIKGYGEPALVLTPPATPTDVDDGLLSASEVAELKLDADWVVLSACNTASGESDAPGAEALSGLAKAFFHAGARSLLVSHWRVDSDATAKLAIATFSKKAINPEIGRAEALRQAMIDLMTQKSDDPWSAYPAFWAPLTIVGEGAF